MPKTGPGRRRLVAPDSIDGISAQIANELSHEIAIAIVAKVRGVAEKMVRASLDSVLAKL